MALTITQKELPSNLDFIEESNPQLLSFINKNDSNLNPKDIETEFKKTIINESDLSHIYIGQQMEVWDKVYLNSAKIISINDDSVVCECLMDKEAKIFQKRIFKKDIFKNFTKLDENTIFLIKFFEKPSNVRIELIEDTENNYADDFIIQDRWDEITFDMKTKE